jgi:hypothetical protein
MYMRYPSAYMFDSGPFLLNKLKDVVTGKGDHAWDLVQLELVVTPGDIVKWTKAVELWERENSTTNPFVVSCPSMDIFDIFPSI